MTETEKPVVKRFTWISVLAVVGFQLGGCTGAPQLLNFPFDPGGRSLNSPADELSPQIAGRYIVFVSDRFGRQDVYLFDGVNRKLVDLPGLNALDAAAENPAISQNGRYIVFAGTRGGVKDIYLYDRTTSQLRNLTENLNAIVRHPTISADGNTIAFESSANGQWDILVINRNGQPLEVPTTPR